jgi:hypothetical protein
MPMQRVCRPPANREFPLGAPGNADLPIVLYEDRPCPDAPALPSLALFFRSLLHVPFTITPFLPATCPSRRRGQNWLCLARKPHVPRPSGPVPPGQPRPELALFRTIGIGLEWWNDGILEYWDSRRPPRPTPPRCPAPGNWVCFAESLPVGARPEIGFVLRICPSPHVPASHVPAGLAGNWLCLAHLLGVPRLVPQIPQGAQILLCFA